MFTFNQDVLFKHCDLAGIVFYPRYFEMINDGIETFFAQVLCTPFKDLHRTGAVPTVQIDTRFAAPSRLGDALVLAMNVTRVGRTSFSYRMQATCKDELRFETTGTLVHVDTSGRPEPWPLDLKKRLSAEKEQQE